MKCLKCGVGKLKKLDTPPTIRLTGEVFIGMECLNCGQRQARKAKPVKRRKPRASTKKGPKDGTDSDNLTADS